MSSVFPLNISDKEDYPDKLAKLEGVDTKYYETAAEINKKRAAIEENKSAIDAISQGAGTPYDTRADFTAVDPAPADGTPFIITNETGHNGQYRADSGEGAGYAVVTLFREVESNGVVEGSEKLVTGGDIAVNFRESLKEAVEATENIFNKDDCTDGYYLNVSDGSLVEDSAWWTSGFIPVEELEDYSALPYIREHVFFTDKKAFIGGSGSIVTSVAMLSTAKFFRFSTTKTIQKEFVIFNKGAAPIPYKRFSNVFKFGSNKAISEQFVEKLTYDSLTTKVASNNNKILSYSDISGWGANYDLSGQSFNAVKIAGAQRGSVASGRDWKFTQVIIKNDKADSTFVAKSKIIQVDDTATILNDLVFALTDDNGAFITLDDGDFSGSTYFVQMLFFNEYFDYAFGGITAGELSNFSGTSFYTLNNVDWVAFSGNPSLGFEHLTITNPSMYEDNERNSKRLEVLERSVNNVKMTLPSEIPLIVGDTLELYYSSLIAFPNWQQFFFASTLFTPSTTPADLRRYLEYTPDDAGDSVLNIKMYDAAGNIADEQNTTVVVKDVVSAPSSPFHYWNFGDSNTARGYYPDEHYRRLTGTGGTPSGFALGNITQHTIGVSGKEWNWFATSVDSPFVYGGVLDIDQYRIDNSLTVPDVIYTYMTWNGMNEDRSDTAWETWMEDVYAILDAFKTAFPSVEIVLMSPHFASQNGGLGLVAGAYNNGYSNVFVSNKNAIKQAQLYERVTTESSYSGWIRHVQVALQFDSKYNMPSALKNVNTRNSDDQELIGTDDVHPSTVGDKGNGQIADAAVRDFVNHYCQ